MLKRFWQDEDGAAMIEYTVLLGLILVATITVIATVGQWISGQWLTVSTTLHQ